MQQHKNWRKWIYISIAAVAIAVLVSALIWYEPWRIWQSGQMVEELQSTNAQKRQQALGQLYSWRLMQRQQLLKKWQPELLAAYEQAINNALAKGEWRNAQLWLQDLQRLYPQLPAAQAAQLKVSAYVAQQINARVTSINLLLTTHRYLTPANLVQLHELQTQLQELSPDHALVRDKRVMYALLLSIDEALAENNFALAEQLLTWGLPRFPAEASLLDRQVQINYKLAGRPAQVFATCIAQGKDCWEITEAQPLFSQPWLLQMKMTHPWFTDWNTSAIIQFELGSYYRRHALQAYAQQQFMQASVDLLKASYFNPPGELSEYWQWLAYAFIEREQSEYQATQQAQLAAFQHTLLTQVAALDVVGAQNTVVAMQTMGADPWFIDQIALPMLGETYLKLAQQLADAQQYELAMRLLMASEQFLPQYGPIPQLLAEYRQATASSMAYQAPGYMNEFADPQLFDEAAKQALGFELPSLAPAAANNGIHPCTIDASVARVNSVQTCQDNLSSQAKGPLLIIPPANPEFASPFAISKYPISIREYNYYCELSKECAPRTLPEFSGKAAVAAAVSDSELDLSDVQDVMQDYDAFCRDTGICNTIEPHAQDMPLTDIKLAEALRYANWLSTTTGYTYRLATVNEWRYAILSDELYRCTSDTLLGLPKKLVPVQQGVTNRWGLVYQLDVMREWVQAPNGMGTMGPEQPENLPVCALPLEVSENARSQNVNTGLRLVRVI